MSGPNSISFSSSDEFVALLGGVYEHSPWVAQRSFPHSPFASLSALIGTMRATVDASSPAERTALLRAHPVLAGKEAAAGSLTASSHSEQKGVGLLNLDADEKARLTALNTAYIERHGFPFVICVRNYTRSEILSELARRLGNPTDVELSASIEQVHNIAEKRITDIFARRKSAL